MDVREARLTDLEGLVILFDAYRQFYEMESDPISARKFLVDRMTKNESIIFVACLDGQIAGFTQLYPAFSSVRMQPVLILNDLFVDSAHRRKGIARALMEKAREYAYSASAAWLQLETAIENHSARALYEHLGYRHNPEYMVYTLSTTSKAES